MPIKIPVHRGRISEVMQGAVAEDGDVYFLLQPARKGRKTGAFQNHGAHIRVLPEKFYPVVYEFVSGLVIICLRTFGTPVLSPQIDELPADAIVTGAFDDIVASELNPDRS